MGTIDAIEAVDAATLAIERLEAVELMLQNLEAWRSDVVRLAGGNALIEHMSREPELTIMIAGDEVALVKDGLRSLLETAEAAR